MPESGTYEVRSLDHPERTAVLYLTGSPRRDAILRFVGDFWHGHGYAPSVREIAAGVGLRSISSTHRHLTLLAGAGQIAYESSTARSIRVVEQ